MDVAEVVSDLEIPRRLSIDRWSCRAPLELATGRLQVATVGVRDRLVVATLAVSQTLPDALREHEGLVEAGVGRRQVAGVAVDGAEVAERPGEARVRRAR